MIKAIVGIWLICLTNAFACPMCASGGPADFVKIDDNRVATAPVSLKRWSVSADARSFGSAEGDEDESHRQFQTGVSVGFRPSAGTLLLARMPYVQSTLDAPHEYRLKQRNSGVGDAEILATVDFFSASRVAWPALTAVVKLPTGDNDVQAEDSDAAHTRLEEHGQIGTGAWDAMLMGHLRHSGSIRWAVTAGFRYNGDNSYGFRYGRVMWFDAEVSHTIYHGFWGGLASRARSTARNSDQGNEEYHSGGNILLFMPEAGYVFGRSLNLFVQGVVPVVNHLNGTQEENFGFSIALTQTF